MNLETQYLNQVRNVLTGNLSQFSNLENLFGDQAMEFVGTLQKVSKRLENSAILYDELSGEDFEEYIAKGDIKQENVEYFKTDFIVSKHLLMQNYENNMNDVDHLKDVMSEIVILMDVLSATPKNFTLNNNAEQLVLNLIMEIDSFVYINMPNITEIEHLVYGDIEVINTLNAIDEDAGVTITASDLISAQEVSDILYKIKTKKM